MRTFVRTTLLSMLITIAALSVWSVIRHPATVNFASAASGLQVPAYCIPPELPGLQELLAKTTNSPARQFLLVKLKAAQQSARDCAANATAHPPAAKPVGAALLPTPVAGPTATPHHGIQHAELLPAGNFLPAEDGYNMWAGIANGHTLEIFAGSISGPDDSEQQAHPDWAAQPALHVQGALRVVVDGDGLNAVVYPNPGRHGALRLVSSCGSLLVLQAADNNLFTFDGIALTYVAPSTLCAVPTP